MHYRIGIDLGGTNIKAGVVNENNEILLEKQIPTKASRPAEEVMQDMAQLVLALLGDGGMRIGGNRVLGVGIGSPGTVDARTGIVVYSNNFGWEHIPLGESLSKALDLPVRISNDANCAALGEVKAGAARDCANCVLITLGTGVGSGIVIDGRIFEGAHAGGAELGHTLLVADGERCTCGRRGCLEAYASATALIRDTRRAAQKNPASLIMGQCGGDLKNVNGQTVFDAAKAGDACAQAVVDRYIRYLGEGIVNAVNLFRPDIVLLGGGICRQGDVLTKPLNAFVRRYCFAGDKGFIPQIGIAELGNSAGILGAAALIG
ncbi:MAG: ROK family protein [Clostridium sp.]|nr:ROK family protein [Clostridium sp.]